MQRLEVSSAVRPLYGSLGVKGLMVPIDQILTFCRRNYFFFNFSTPVYEMWIIEEPNTLELWNKLHFKERKKKRRVYTAFNIFSTYICWINIWNATLGVSGAVRPPIWVVRRQRVKWLITTVRLMEMLQDMGGDNRLSGSKRILLLYGRIVTEFRNCVTCVVSFILMP